MAWLAKLNGMCGTTRRCCSSAPSGLTMMSRMAMAASCQSTRPSPLRSRVRTTVAYGSGSVASTGEVAARWVHWPQVRRAVRWPSSWTVCRHSRPFSQVVPAAEEGLSQTVLVSTAAASRSVLTTA